jgi:hypothetical protein
MQNTYLSDYPIRLELCLKVLMITQNYIFPGKIIGLTHFQNIICLLRDFTKINGSMVK